MSDETHNPSPSSTESFGEAKSIETTTTPTLENQVDLGDSGPSVPVEALGANGGDLIPPEIGNTTPISNGTSINNPENADSTEVEMANPASAEGHGEASNTLPISRL